MAKRRAGSTRTQAVIAIVCAAVLLGSLFVVATNETVPADGSNADGSNAVSSNAQANSDVLNATGVVPAPARALQGSGSGGGGSATTTPGPYAEGRISVKAGGHFKAMLEYKKTTTAAPTP